MLVSSHLSNSELQVPLRVELEEDIEPQEVLALAIGVASLLAFVQANLTGYILNGNLSVVSLSSLSIYYLSCETFRWIGTLPCSPNPVVIKSRQA